MDKAAQIEIKNIKENIDSIGAAIEAVAGESFALLTLLNAYGEQCTKLGVEMYKAEVEAAGELD